MFISEFGTDSYHSIRWWPVAGYEDEDMQSEFLHSLWVDMRSGLSANESQKVCVGGTIFEWVDEWWKVKDQDGGSPFVHDNGGFETYWNPSAHPDGFGNEEYFGIVHIERVKKKVYATLQKDFFLSGDVDNNGQTTIDEVQRAINQFLGISSVEPCNDLNGNGEVTIDEVQKVINAFLGI